MPNTFGAIELPVPVPATGQPVGDVALHHLGSFVKAVLNATAATAWATVDKRNPPVKKFFTHDPERVDVKDADFPSVFVYSTGSSQANNADDFTGTKRNIDIFWLFEPLPQAQQARRLPFFQAILAALYQAFARGRHPAWVVAGEDPSKVSRGSLIWSRCGFLSRRVTSSRLDGLQVDMIEGGKIREYDGVLITLEVEERLFEDPAAYVGGSGVNPAALTADITNPETGDVTLRAVEQPQEEATP